MAKTLPASSAEVEDRDEILKTLRADLAEAAAAYRKAASALTAERKAAAAKLAKLAEAQINSLAMKVRFRNRRPLALGRQMRSSRKRRSRKRQGTT